MYLPGIPAPVVTRSTDKIKADYPQLPAFETYDELLNGIKAAMA